VTDDGHTLYWWEGTLYTQSGRPIVNCTWPEVLDQVRTTATPVHLYRMKPPKR
jgi:hypothetical protein